jgi:GTP-binding protein
MADHAANQAGQAAAGTHLSAAEEAARIEAGRHLFAQDCRLVHAARRVEELPPAGAPEVAFAGRSNVGKSSLLNALTGRRMLARTSAEPGRTRQLNFFDLGGRLALVDMPGYGYAAAAKALKQDWQGLMFAYLRGRPTLRQVLLLLDARIEVKASDEAAMDLLDRAAVGYRLVLTKADALAPAALCRKQAEVTELARRRPAAHMQVLASSSATGEGIAALRAALAELVDPEATSPHKAGAT